MASQSDDPSSNPWAASPAESPAVEAGPSVMTAFDDSHDDNEDDDKTRKAERDAWRRSGSSDEGDSFKPVVSNSHQLPLHTAFDEFDPFRPDDKLDGTTSTSRGASSSSVAEDKDEATLEWDDGRTKARSEDTPPATPSKTTSTLSRAVESPTSPTHDTISRAATQQAERNHTSSDNLSHSSESKNQSKLSTANNASSSSSATSTTTSPQSTASSALSNPLATIASAFRKRDFSSASSKDASRSNTPVPSSSTTTASTSTLQPIAPPVGKPAPVILIRDNDENMLIDESEKEAPPAVPSHSIYTSSSSSSNPTSQSNKHDNHNKGGSGGEGVVGIEEDSNQSFDFNFFLEQMRNKSAEPIAKYLRSFLREFSKKHWNVNDQIRVINDFLDFIAIKMRENEVWKNDTEREFDNAVEGMEKLVMNRLFSLTFVPALEPNQQSITQTDDLERDHVLSQRIKLFQWVNEEHLDLPIHKDTASFVEFAKQELRKINLYKAPRDKLICILNSCKVIFGLMRHLNLEDGADTFIPFLILVVLRSNPDHLISNVQYISRFRNPDRLSGENGYYLSSLNASISFIETMDSSSLSNIKQDEFEKNVENAIRNLPSDDNQNELPAVLPSTSNTTNVFDKASNQASSSSARKGHSIPNSPTKAAQRPINEKRMSHSASESSLQAHQQQPPPRSQSPAEATRDFFLRSSDNLQKTVSKPLQALGKIFTEMGSESEMIAGFPGHGHQQSSSASDNTASASGQGNNMNRLQSPLSPHMGQPPTPRGQRPPSLRTRSTTGLASPISPQGRSSRLPQGHYAPNYSPNLPQQQQRPGPGQSRPSTYQAADFLDDSIPAEEVQATVDKNYQANFNAKIDTLVNIFSDIERETLEIVLLSNGEDVERTIEGLLDMQ